MLFGVLFDLLEVLIVTVFCEPRNDITVRPVNLQCVRVLVVNVILSAPETISHERRERKKNHTSMGI